MARKKKLSTEELGKNREDLMGQWREIANQVEEIDDELSSREQKENYDKKHLKEIQKKYTGKIIMLKNRVHHWIVLIPLIFMMLRKLCLIQQTSSI